MPLEATVVCLDASEYMRNGDFTPNRLDAMKDCASLLVDAKYAMNPESSVGIVATGYAMGPKALCSCSPAESAINPLNACSTLTIQNAAQTAQTDFQLCAALQVSALTLKHRRNKNGQARIVLFCGSPIADSVQDLVKIGKNLKKNNIAVDIVSLGEPNANTEKLEAFMEAVQKSNLCTLVVCPPGVLVSDVVTTSPIFQGNEGGNEEGGGARAAQAGQAASFAEYGGVDPSLDPEMAMALRASMEEERARLAAAAAAAAAAETPVAQPPAQQEQTDEEAMLAEAILLSMKGDDEAEEAKPAAVKDEQENDDDEEARQLALAMAMSQEEDEEGAKPPTAAAGEKTEAYLDPQYVNQLLEGLEGLDKNDPVIQALLKQQQKDDDDDQPDSKKSRKDKE